MGSFRQTAFRADTDEPEGGITLPHALVHASRLDRVAALAMTVKWPLKIDSV